MLLINNLSARLAPHEARIRAAVDRVVASGWLVLGPEVTRFERSFAAYHGVAHCLGVANGTDALELALRAVGVTAGERVATAANAGSYSTTALLAIGAEPLFMDVSLETRCATLAEVRRAVEAGCKAVVVTHLYGQAAPEIAAIADYCAGKQIPLVEDCAQAHGARVGGKPAGSFGTVACFSFYPTKNLGALGDGGAVLTGDAFVAENVKLLRQYGWKDKYRIEVAGARNSRLDELQAAILSELLPHLDEANARRRAIAARLSASIRHPQVTVPAAGGEDFVAHLYVVRSPKRDGLRAHLHEQGIASDLHYPIPDHRQPVFRGRYDDVRLPNTERLVTEILTLPCYAEMSDQDVERVVEAVNGWAA
jgi:dTDP-4-amino-4,6-dideoxygalactose transaminase